MLIDNLVVVLMTKACQYAITYRTLKQVIEWFYGMQQSPVGKW